jgi:hypothetical protein
MHCARGGDGPRATGVSVRAHPVMITAASSVIDKAARVMAPF